MLITEISSICGSNALAPVQRAVENPPRVRPIAQRLHQSMTRLIPFVLLLLLAPGVAAAADKPAYKRWYELQYTIRSAARMDVTQRIETEVSSASLLQSLGQHRLVNNDHFFDLDILEAATIKPDGRRVEVDRSQIAVLSGAESTTNILFQADVKTRVIPFPELTAGDHTVIAYRVSQKQPAGLGGNSIALAFPPALYFAGMKVTVDAPADLPLQVTERALQHETKTAGGHKILTWTVDEQPYAAAEANSVAPIDWAPMLAVSTYASWDAIGKAEFALADPKSQPDDKVRALADDVTRGISDRRAQAAAIFDWVATNIRYYEIILNQGGWMPHPAGDILKNRYGDCKDHATLMRAMLRAKGIDAEFVMINAMSRVFGTYQIPNTSFDHMILYLPEFGIYADPTSATASLGVLPAAEYDRPVLRLAARNITWTRTPAQARRPQIRPRHRRGGRARWQCHWHQRDARLGSARDRGAQCHARHRAARRIRGRQGVADPAGLDRHGLVRRAFAVRARRQL